MSIYISTYNIMNLLGNFIKYTPMYRSPLQTTEKKSRHPLWTCIRLRIDFASISQRVFVMEILQAYFWAKGAPTHRLRQSISFGSNKAFNFITRVNLNEAEGFSWCRSLGTEPTHFPMWNIDSRPSPPPTPSHASIWPVINLIWIGFEKHKYDNHIITHFIFSSALGGDFVRSNKYLSF